MGNSWAKLTGGIQNLSEELAPETLTLSFFPAHSGTLYPIDLWGVFIRRDIPVVNTWDMYIDLYSCGVKERSLIIEDVFYKKVEVGEQMNGDRGKVDLSSKRLAPKEIIY